LLRRGKNPGVPQDVVAQLPIRFAFWVIASLGIGGLHLLSLWGNTDVSAPGQGPKD
jgi:hypothetical protein